MTDPCPTPDDRPVTVPARVLAILCEELAGQGGHGGAAEVHGCPICDAIRDAREALRDG